LEEFKKALEDLGKKYDARTVTPNTAVFNLFDSNSNEYVSLSELKEGFISLRPNSNDS
jgi:hypothetical protein